MIHRFLLRITHRMWNRAISRILCRAYTERVINSEQMHVLASAFDPTQKHMIYGEHVNRKVNPSQ